MNRQQRLPYLQKVVDAGIVRHERPQYWYMKEFLCTQCRYHEIEREYGDVGSVASYPICTHPLEAVVERFNSSSECGTPWFPYSDPPPPCWNCGHAGHQYQCWHIDKETVEGELLGEKITFCQATCTCRVMTPERFVVNINTVWDCFGFRPAPKKKPIDEQKLSVLSFSS